MGKGLIYEQAGGGVIPLPPTSHFARQKNFRSKCNKKSFMRSLSAQDTFAQRKITKKNLWCSKFFSLLCKIVNFNYVLQNFNYVLQILPISYFLGRSEGTVLLFFGTALIFIISISCQRIAC